MAYSAEFWAISGMGLSNFAVLIGVVVGMLKDRKGKKDVCVFHEDRGGCIDGHSKRIRRLEVKVAVLESRHHREHESDDENSGRD